jgi:Cys-tRNA(Pro)/Cys-tRNA(Cys) deacylase
MGIKRGNENMAHKTNAARILDQNKITYELKEYVYDESDLSAVNVAGKIGLPIEQVFKSLVARGDKTGIILACIQGDKELNLKSLAILSKNKKVELVPLKEIQPLTGYIRGGVSPVGLKKNYPIFISSDITKQEKVAVSAGLRGLQVFLRSLDLISVTKAQLGVISD